MSDTERFDGCTPYEAAEEVAHEIRSRQLHVLTLIQLMQKIESGELDSRTLKTPIDIATGFSDIQDCVHEISDLMDSLLVYMRKQENN